jgi:hypothetical protein
MANNVTNVTLAANIFWEVHGYAAELWQLYSQNKQTDCRRICHSLFGKYKYDSYLRMVKEDFECKYFPDSRVILMDTTYFGKDFGVVVLKDFSRGNPLCRKYVKYKRLIDYRVFSVNICLFNSNVLISFCKFNQAIFDTKSKIGSR